MSEDFDKLWDYGKPGETEKKFRALLPAAETSGDRSYHAQLLTQIARTYSLRGKFAETHATLDDAEKLLTPNLKLARVRYLLERGRTFNSASEQAKALPLFHAAAGLSKEIENWRLHIDAIHMLAIAEPNPGDQLKWNLAGIALVEEHPDQRGWLYALYNNTGETYVKLGRYEDALGSFKKLVALDEEKHQPPDMYAQLDIARCLNLLDRAEHALEQLKTIEQHNDVKESGYFHEQMGEALQALGKIAEGKQHSAVAYKLIGQEQWMQEQPQRLARLKQLAEVTVRTR